MAKKRRRNDDFSDLSPQDAIGLVVNTAVVARDSGHPVEVRHGRVRGRRGLLVFMPGWEMRDGSIVRVGGGDQGSGDGGWGEA